ncbi:MAG: N-formylglutamate amidohydrolase [Rhodospirillaceae bacterium]
MPIGLLTEGEPPAVVTLRENGRSPFFLACDHAGNRLPRKLGDLGLPPAELQRHIAWDIGAAGVTRFMSERLDAFAILQTYSRLVIDCNRSPAVASSIVDLSEYTAIPGNRDLSQGAREMRVNEIFHPYHNRIHAELDRRERDGIPTALIAVHSFTPVFKGNARPWQAGLLYNRDHRLAKPLMEVLSKDGDLVVGDNEPYAVSDESDYTIPVHGERRGLPHIEFEVRQDLIADEAGQRQWAERLADALIYAWQAITP